ncbi:hypothetical protein [Catenovulum adriaticum]|uniref:DUF3828 domain-containing protein n=1 Tax=Catenovulum adriaticum TaxID=2984846 RepID=A0ABY7APB9_9ALTE|nr:hypothetical protein [Catenovulum sp. TS8]WAJ70159.1 hypothetical protein OLW01_13600 [Catenovulum sp. TS8]
MNSLRKQWLIAMLLFATGISSLAEAKTHIAYQDQGEQAFTLVQKYKLHQQKYQDVVIENFVPAARDVNNGADQQVVRFLSAIVKDDFAWWKSTWTQETLNDWDQKLVLNKDKRLFNYWKARVNHQTKVQLVDFIVFKQTVLVGFNLLNQQREYHLLALVLEDSRWRLDQNFMQSDLYRQIKQSVY